MPELPEVEVTKRALLEQVGQQIENTKVNTASLRWPIPTNIKDNLNGQTLLSVSRRAKYLLLQFETGFLIIHLGMSGCLRILQDNSPLKKHDHFELFISNGSVMRLNDPRRFGAVLWAENWQSHRLFINLGVEPLSQSFTGDYLSKLANKRSLPIKNFIMDQKIVVGVGNIYANESLFLAGISPIKVSGKITTDEMQRLVIQIKLVLAKAIKQGGTTLKDFANPDGKPGYFAQQLTIYGRAGEPCIICKTTISLIKQSGRQTVFCPVCQSID